MPLGRAPRALDVGSGHNPVSASGWYKPGDVAELTFTNMDAHHPSADVKHFMEDIPWPFPDDTFDVIFARHSLEHVPRDKFLDVFREIQRVAKPDALVYIRVPYWNSEAFAGDPTHWNPFCEVTFRHMCFGGSLNTEYYMPVGFRADIMEFRFQPKFRFIPKRILRELMHILCGVCDEMWVTLQVIKPAPPDGAVKYEPKYSYTWTVPFPYVRFPFWSSLLYGELFWGTAAIAVLAVLNAFASLLLRLLH